MTGHNARRTIAAGATSIALMTALGTAVSPASADQGLPDLRAQCHLGGDMFVAAAPKGTVQVDYWSVYTVSSTERPRFAAPTYSWLRPGDWIYAFALDANGNVIAQNHHAVCVTTD